MQANEQLERRHLWFSGHVQGVGFRYNSHRVARHYQVTGFVRNLPGGEVEMVIEGEKSEVLGCLEEVLDKLGPFIRDVREGDRTATGGFSDFEIRY